MNTELCAIKGTREGLVITIRDAVQFSEVLVSLERQLLASQSFFRGSSAKLYLQEGTLTDSQMDEIERLIADYGMRLNREPLTVQMPRPQAEQVATETSEVREDNTLLVRRTIRSGQRLHYDGNVVVMGDVNPGAEIVCTGDILVLGSLRGVAHAGAEGKVDATVFAFRLEPTQLRIAHVISRAPDEKLPQPSGPEIARVVENSIQLSVYNH
ncbi:MAG TPA: septum site-determining protein MinC [Limnochordia bacterium]|jgi:septum site-determining protein MinC|nr:septum site-determining protein MinC [Bacillota bacterium]HKM43129.1 septum site-determining protein MinC [Limnochordia bacterium]